MVMCLRFYNDSEHVEHIFYIVQTEHIVRYMRFVLIPLYVARRVSCYIVDLSIQIISDGKLSLFQQISDVRIVNEAQQSHCLDEFGHCILFLSA